MKLIASDLDGTLLNDRGEISERNIAAIKKALDYGLRFIVATGRSWESASKPLQAAGIDCPVICLNGAAMYDEHARLLQSTVMERKVAKSVLSVSRKANMYLEFFTNKGIFSTSREYFLEVLVDIMKSANPALTEEEIRKHAHLRFQAEPVEFIDDYDKIFQMEDVVIYKILGFSMDPEKLVEVRTELGDLGGLTITSSGDINLEFNHPEAQKGAALLQLANRLNIPMNEVIAVGDNWNDVSMLQAAGKGIAMANADEEIKQLADGITKSNADDGVAAVIENVLNGEY